MKSSQASSAQKSTKMESKKDTLMPNADAAKGLRGLFVNELKDIYWAEKALLKAIPKMIKNTTSEELNEALAAHLMITNTHVKRLQDVFEAIGENAMAKKCQAMEGLIKEAEEIMEETEGGVVRDAGIISAAQKVEHYEIATYGTLASLARTLGENEAAELLEETLEEEKEADAKLSEIAESSVNMEAAESDNGTATKSKRK